MPLLCLDESNEKLELKNIHMVYIIILDTRVPRLKQSKLTSEKERQLQIVDAKCEQVKALVVACRGRTSRGDEDLPSTHEPNVSWVVHVYKFTAGLARD